jgi:hypothetical protein
MPFTIHVEVTPATSLRFLDGVAQTEGSDAGNHAT